jgi:uncharacterized protein YecE (DUF72 family)
MESSVPPITAITNPALSIVRFHGRRTDHWERPAKVASERFRYLYDAGELSEWLPKIDELASRAQEIHLVFNNCYANYGTTNAVEIAAMLRGRHET